MTDAGQFISARESAILLKLLLQEDDKLVKGAKLHFLARSAVAASTSSQPSPGKGEA